MSMCDYDVFILSSHHLQLLSTPSSRARMLLSTQCHLKQHRRQSASTLPLHQRHSLVCVWITFRMQSCTSRVKIISVVLISDIAAPSVPEHASVPQVGIVIVITTIATCSTSSSIDDASSHRSPLRSPVSSLQCPSWRFIELILFSSSLNSSSSSSSLSSSSASRS